MQISAVVTNGVTCESAPRQGRFGFAAGYGPSPTGLRPSRQRTDTSESRIAHLQRFDKGLVLHSFKRYIFSNA